MRSKRVSKVATKSLPLEKDDRICSYDKHEYYCSKTMYYTKCAGLTKCKGIHSDELIHITVKKDLKCYYNENTKKFYLSYTYIRFDNDGNANISHWS